MAFIPKNWANGQTVYAEDMNRIEQGIVQEPTRQIDIHDEDPDAHPSLKTAIQEVQDAQPIIGTTPPTTSTVGVVGQEYIDTEAKLVYHCTAAGSTGYTWISADKNLQDTKQDKSTAITTSNIANQTVSKAKYATDDVAVGTPALRNQYFASAEATPTVNGQICWVYG